GDDRRDDRDDVARIHRNLVAEAAADVSADDADLALRDPRQHRHDGAHEVRSLGGHPHRELPGWLVERGDTATRLERTRMHTRIEDLLAHRDLRTCECGIHARLVARIPSENVVGMRPLSVADLVLVGDILADDWRAFR